MDRDPSWIDRGALRSLVKETAWRRVAPEPETRRADLPPEGVPRFLTEPPPARAPASVAPPAPPVPTTAPPIAAPPPEEQSPRQLEVLGGDRLRRASRPRRPTEIDPSAVTIKVPPPPPPGYVRMAVDPYVAAHQGSLEERIDRLLGWALESASMTSAFVADKDGLLLAARDTSASDEASATVFEQFLRQFEGFTGSRVDGHVLLTAGRRPLLVTWRHTPHGRYYLGLAGGTTPPLELVPPLGRALADALEAP